MSWWNPYSKEHCNEAESLVAGIEACAGKGEDEVETLCKLAQVDMYKEKLRERDRLYISYKTCLLRDHLSKKKGQIPKPVHPSGLDKLHRKKIFNFLLHSGWISAY